MRRLLRHLRFATCVAVFCLSSVAGGGAQQPAVTPERVAGRVVDAKTGRPLAHALVTLTKTRSDNTVASVYTDSDGRYRFGTITPGKYRLEGASTGHLSSGYLGHGTLSTAIVIGAGLPVDSLVLSLVPAASISGRVLDENGEPVPHAQISLFRQGTDIGMTGIRPAGARPVDDDGDFEFYPLTPGRYFLCARGTPWYAVHPPTDPPNARFLIESSVDPALDVAYATVFYPAAASEEGASPLQVAEGDEVTANFQLSPQHALTFTLRRPGNAQNTPPPQLMENIFGTELPVITQVSFNGQEQMLTGIAPGRYELRQYSSGNRLPASSGTIDLTADTVRDTSAPPDLASVTLTVQAMDGQPLPKQAIVTVVPTGQNGTMLSRPINDKGVAELDDLPPGDYRLRVSGGRRASLPVGSLTVAGSPVPDRRLHIQSGGHLVASVALTGPPVTVEGFVRQDGKPVAGSMVVLVPAGGDTESDLFRRDQSDLDGSFSLAGVSPGKYLLIALDDAWSLPWTDPHALTPFLLHAQPLVIPSEGPDTIRLSGPVSPQTLR